MSASHAYYEADVRRVDPEHDFWSAEVFQVLLGTRTYVGTIRGESSREAVIAAATKLAGAYERGELTDETVRLDLE